MHIELWHVLVAGYAASVAVFFNIALQAVSASDIGIDE